MISDAQFGHLAREVQPVSHGGQGGFTINPRTGRRPRTGWAVAMQGYEHEMPLPQVSGPAIKDYVRRHEGTLGQEGVYVGGWGPEPKEPRHGSAILDHTHVEKNPRNAFKRMVEEDQDAAYHLQSGTMLNPYHDLNSRNRGQRLGLTREQHARRVANRFRKEAGKALLPEL